MLRLVVQLTNEDCEFLKCKYFQHQDRLSVLQFMPFLFISQPIFDLVKHIRIPQNCLRNFATTAFAEN